MTYEGNSAFLKDYIEKGLTTGLDKTDYIVLKCFLVKLEEEKSDDSKVQEQILLVKRILSLMYNNGVLSKLSEDSIKYIVNNSYLLPLVLTNSETIKRGKEDSYFCLCPFHEDHYPSFKIINHKNLGYCFSCKRKFNVISYLKHYENLNYIEAIELLSYIFMFDIGYNNDKVKSRAEKYQKTIVGTKYISLLNEEHNRMKDEKIVSDKIKKRFLENYVMINRIALQRYDSAFYAEHTEKKLVLTPSFKVGE